MKKFENITIENADKMDYSSLLDAVRNELAKEGIEGESATIIADLMVQFDEDIYEIDEQYYPESQKPQYIIDFGTGAGNETAESLNDAKIKADENCSYTGCSITIKKGGEIVLSRKWVGVKFDENFDESQDPIEFGNFGYYADWIEL